MMLTLRCQLVRLPLLRYTSPVGFARVRLGSDSSGRYRYTYGTSYRSTGPSSCSTNCVYHQACAAVAHPRGCWLTMPIEASRRLYRIFSPSCTPRQQPCLRARQHQHDGQAGLCRAPRAAVRSSTERCHVVESITPRASDALRRCCVRSTQSALAVA